MVNIDVSKCVMIVVFGLFIMLMLSGVLVMSYFIKYIFEMTGYTFTAASGMTTAFVLCKFIVIIFVVMFFEIFG